jgi:hypothetical protein
MRCCRPYGYLPAWHGLLLSRLIDAGAELEEDDRIWGPGDGWAWRVVGRTGRQKLGSRVSVRAATAADAKFRVSDDGEVRLAD